MAFLRSIKILKTEVNQMLMIDTPTLEVSGQLEYPAHNEELNRLLCAAVVSKSFRNMLLDNPEVAVASGYQGESFNLTTEDRSWLLSTRSTSLVDLAANMAVYQQNIRQDQTLRIPAKTAEHLVRVN